ncbi:PREDICTED: tenascin-X [Nanorana parkeri]|uniref:tenascin-X n=1 Tax=Nanorana parkeri TaxID=125878 RepID=UPI00085420D1|nr:PREDICTED: tenascin-X [Nanorana parkeri]
MGDKCLLKTCPEDCNDQGKCTNGRCICFEGYSGVTCSIKACLNNCHNHGKCEDGVCNCDSGYSGEDCSSRVCPRNCLNRGRCENGLCVCYPGYAGVDCGFTSCPNNCNNRGVCKDGACVCNTGFTGSECDIRSCLHDCNNNGRCSDGVCACNPGYFGEDCGYRGCPEDCNEQGQCISGKCVCDAGFVGADCGTRICSPECERRGRCEDGECICNPGFTGQDCEIRTCPNDCHKQGRCDDGKCICDPGYTGPDCKIKACPNKCNNRGRCENGICICNPGFSGPDCGVRTCPKNCHDRGRCEGGVCFCDAGYNGLDCGTKRCPNDCYDRGHCEDGVCVCDYGFTGQDCGSRTCPNDCYNRGRCENGMCVCDAGYKGEDCGIRTCPNDCHGQGRCEDGVCVCDFGYTGIDCGSRTCPSDCYNHGRCEDGQCICEAGYTGQDCASRTCPENCNNRGTCDDGKCSCHSGYTGPDCGSRTCRNDCNGRGRCEDGICICDPGYTDIDCGLKNCLNDCHNRGQCDDSVCICNSGYTGPDCSERTCPEDCHSHGRCDNGKCVCDPGYVGLDCGSQACPENCHVHGQCQDGVCICNSGFTGLDCSSKACPKNCNNKGQCVNGKCICEVGYIGPVCGTKACPGNCNGHGKCVNGVCTCKKGYSGPDCTIDILIEIVAVTGLQVITQEESAITLEWDRPQAAPDSYDISFKAKKENGIISTTIEGSLTSYHQTGLAPGEEYIVNIQPRKGPTLGPETSITATTRIETLRGLRVTEATSSSLFIRWERPQVLPDRYIVTLIHPDGKEKKMRIPGKMDRAKVSGLEPDTEYRIILRTEKEQEQSQDTETTGVTAGEERKRSNVEEKDKDRGSVGTSRTVDTSETTIQRNQHFSSVPKKDLSLGGEDDGILTKETREIITGGQKGSKLIHTTKNITTIITTIYQTRHHQNGRVVNVHHETEDLDHSSTIPPHSEEDFVITSVKVDDDIDQLTPLDSINNLPGRKAEKWMVTKNITHITTVSKESPTKLQEEEIEEDVHRTTSTHSKVRFPGGGRLPGTSSVAKKLREIELLKKKSVSQSSNDEKPTPVYPEGPFGPSKTEDILHKLPPPVHQDHLEILESEITSETPTESNFETEQTGGIGGNNLGGEHSDPTKSRKQITTLVKLNRTVNTTRRKVIGGDDNKVTHNETVVVESHKAVREPGGKVKNHTRILGPQMKSVIENLPEKLSLYNGTFIQRLESYLRSTSYPLKGNQTVETIARAIYLYLVKWKPDSFTEMVYDRLPQKTPGATGYSEPIGASRLQGNFGNAVEESRVKNLGNTTDQTDEGAVLVRRPDSSKTFLVVPSVKTLGRVEAVGEIEGPDTLPVRNYDSTSEVTDRNGDVQDKEKYELTNVIDSDSKPAPSKPVLDKSKGSRKPPPKKPTTPEKEIGRKEDKKKPISETKKVEKATNQEELEKFPPSLHVTDYETPSRIGTLGRPTKKPKVKPSLSSVVQSGTLNVDPTPGTSLPNKETDKRVHLLRVIDEPNNQDKSSVVNQIPGSGEGQGKADPIQSPSLAKVPGPEAQGRPSIHQRSSTSLVISLEGLGFLWDRVIILYSPWPPTDGVTPQKMEVDRGTRQVEIQDLRPGTSYRFDLHGLLRGRSSKSYSLVAETAPLNTAPPHTERSTLPPYTTTTTASTVSPRLPLGGLEVRDITSDSVSLIWKAKSNFFESFLVRYEDVSGSATSKETSVPGQQREVTLRDLTERTRYAVSVYGIRGGKLSRPLKEEVTTDAAPGEDIPKPPRLSPISVSDVQTDSFRITWEPLDGDFDAFVIQYGPPGGPTQEETVQGDQTTFLITGLRAQVNYTVEIRGVWGDSYTNPETAHVFTEKLQPPRLESLSPSDIRSDSVHLTWEVKGSDFDSFLLSYRDGEGQPQEIPLEGDVRSYDVKELKAGKKYKFTLHGLIEGKRTKPVTAEITTEKSVPPRLESLFASDILSDSLRLSWEVSGGEFDSFLLLYRDVEGKPKELTLDGEQRTLSVEDLKPGKKYKFILYGLTGGKRSKAVTLETTTAPGKVVPTTPSTPVTRLVNFKSTEVTKDSVTLSWLVEGILFFDWIVLQYREPEGGIRELQIPGQDSSTIVQGLLPSQKYEFTVYGLRGDKRSESLSTQVQTDYPETVGPPVVTELYISTHGPHAIHLSWEAPEASFESFLVRYKVESQDGPLNTVTADGTDRNLLLSGLQPDTVYTVTLHGIRDGNEQSSMQNTGKTAPLDLEPPKKLKFSNIQEKSAIVTWDPPSPDTTTFKVSYEPADGGEPESVNVVGTTTTLKRLTPGTKYEVTVVTMRGFEESSPLTGYLTTAGGGPRSLRAHDVTEVSALLRWEAPTGPVDQYLITYRAENIPLITVPVPGDKTELPLSGLHPHTEYFVSVQSQHGPATSAPSSTSFTTSADTPRDLTATQITARTAVLTWEAPDVEPDAYLLTYQTPQGEAKEIHLLSNITSFLLNQLDPTTQYTVQLHALRHGSASAPISTSFTTGRIRYPYPRDCWEQRMNGEVQNGPFTIHLGGSREDQLTVYCDMETDGGGWVVFQRRMDGSINFYRDWPDYKNGFGNITGEFWLGNIALHQITSSAPYELRVDLRAGDESAYAVYDDFRVEGENQQFRLRLGKYRGTAGDSMDYHNNMVFSTRDRDTQRRILPCAMSYKGAWWYRNCHYANLNGLYANNKDHQGVNWKTWKGFEFSIPFTEMKMRPRGMGNWRRL